MTDLEKFKIELSVAPDIEVTIKTKEPGDALALSGCLVVFMRESMKLEPKSKVYQHLKPRQER